MLPLPKTGGKLSRSKKMGLWGPFELKRPLVTKILISVGVFGVLSCYLDLLKMIAQEKDSGFGWKI
jgi:hypothetical protein